MHEVLIANGSVIAALMFGVWLISLPLRDVSVIDIAWGLGFVLVAWTTYFFGGGEGVGRLLLAVLVTLWGLRLSGYLAWRKAGSPEDYRYREMRDRHPRSFPLLSLLTVFTLQGILMWIVALPIQTTDPTAPSSLVLTAFGVLVWTVGLAFEAIGDVQMAHFKSEAANAGRVLDRGLWRYTRHPNYFGDFLVWWGIYLVSLALGAPWWSVIGPILMSVLLMRVSGVTLLEKALKERKEGYGEYATRTNAFFPWWPRQAC
jgi:steroid 5-alpha reductase family enzyme